jgi:hypothetical protein
MSSIRMIELKVELDGQAYNCQLIDPEHIPPAYADTTSRTETACPDGYEDDTTGQWTPGSLKGNAFAATEATGLTWILRTAQHQRKLIAYTITHAPELGAAGGITETGNARVKTFSYGTFAKPGLWKHPVDLELIDTSGPTRPADIPITGVTAGTPGAFQPAGATIPADLADLKADPAVGDTGTAKPSTAWTAGQYVNLGDASKASWDGTAWIAGPAA